MRSLHEKGRLARDEFCCSMIQELSVQASGAMRSVLVSPPEGLAPGGNEHPKDHYLATRVFARA